MTRSQFRGTTNSRILSPVIISSKYSRNGTEKLSAIWNQRLITKQATAYLCTNAWTPLICACVCGPDQEMYEWVWEFKQIKLKWCIYRTQRGETTGDSRTPMIVAEFPLITSNSGNPSITVWLLLSESYFLQFSLNSAYFQGQDVLQNPADIICFKDCQDAEQGSGFQVILISFAAFPTSDTDSSLLSAEFGFSRIISGHFGFQVPKSHWII